MIILILKNTLHCLKRRESKIYEDVLCALSFCGRGGEKGAGENDNGQDINQ